MKKCLVFLILAVIPALGFADDLLDAVLREDVPPAKPNPAARAAAPVPFGRAPAKAAAGTSAPVRSRNVPEDSLDSRIQGTRQRVENAVEAGRKYMMERESGTMEGNTDFDSDDCSAAGMERLARLSLRFGGGPIPVSGSQTVSITYYDPDNSYYTASTSYTITVRDQILALSSTTLSGTGGLSTSLTATPTYFSGTPTYIWSSSNTSVVVVNGNGNTANVTYIAGGSAVITCRATLGSQTATATCLVSVEDGIPVTGVTVAPSSMTITIGNTTTLTATVRPANATNQNVIWYSDSTAIATVDSNGVVTGVAVGTTNIFAFSDTNGNGVWEQGEPRGGGSITVRN